MTMLEANPSMRRQIATTSPWIFWRDAPDGRGRQGFVCAIEVCDNPDCPCTEVRLIGRIVDERLRHVSLTDNRLECDFNASLLRETERAGGIVLPRGAVRINFQTGEVRPEAT